MGFNAKDAIDAAKDIVTNAVERSSDIVENAGHIIKGDIAGGTGDIVHNSTRHRHLRRRQGQRGLHRQARRRRDNPGVAGPFVRRWRPR